MSAEPGQRPSSCREFLEDLTGQSRAAAAGPAKPVAAAPVVAATDVWYLVYRDENSQPHTVKGSTDGIRKALRDRLLGDPSGVVVSRTKNGHFVPLHNTPEFRDLVVTPTPMPLPNARVPGPDETNPYEPPPSGARSGKPAAPSSGRLPPAPPAPVPPSRQSGSRPRAAAPAEPAPDSTLYQYGQTPVSQPTPNPNSGRTRRPSEREDPDAVKMFNWTPVLLVVVVVLSAVVSYLAFFK